MGVFARVVDRGSFAAAADDLGLSPSAVSKLLTRLETRLGVRLLDRTTRRLALTAEGEVFLERSRKILDAIEFSGERYLGGPPRGARPPESSRIPVVCGRSSVRRAARIPRALPARHVRLPGHQPGGRSGRGQHRRRAACRLAWRSCICDAQDRRPDAGRLRELRLFGEARRASSPPRSCPTRMPDAQSYSEFAVLVVQYRWRSCRGRGSWAGRRRQRAHASQACGKWGGNCSLWGHHRRRSDPKWATRSPDGEFSAARELPALGRFSAAPTTNASREGVS